MVEWWREGRAKGFNIFKCSWQECCLMTMKDGKLSNRKQSGIQFQLARRNRMKISERLTLIKHPTAYICIEPQDLQMKELNNCMTSYIIVSPFPSVELPIMTV